MIMMTTVMMMKVMMATVMVTMMTPLVLISEGVCEKYRDHFQLCSARQISVQSYDTQTHSDVDSIYLKRHTHVVRVVDLPMVL